MKRLRMIVIGFGFMGKTHAANILSSDLLELCGVVDSRPKDSLFANTGGNLQTDSADAASLADIPFFASIEEAFASLQPDGVVIALPTVAHEPTARFCLEQGCHVFLEKPVCLDAELGAALVQTAIAHQKTFMVGHCVRFMPAYEKLREAVTGGTLGALKLLTLDRATGAPNWGAWNDPAVRESSGGALFDLTIHDIDYARHLLGEPDEVWSPPGFSQTFGSEYVNATWRYESGTTVLIRGGFLFPPERPFECGYSALFERGALLHSSREPDLVWRLEGGSRQALPVADATDSYRQELEYFAACAQDEKPPVRCAPEDAVAAVRLAWRHL
jgi:predicted dehydrogenase